jgi:hypothetical protein
MRQAPWRDRYVKRVLARPLQPRAPQLFSSRYCCAITCHQSSVNASVSSVICHVSSFCHPSSVICHLSSAICHLSSMSSATCHHDWSFLLCAASCFMLHVSFMLHVYASCFMLHASCFMFHVSCFYAMFCLCHVSMFHSFMFMSSSCFYVSCFHVS